MKLDIEREVCALRKLSVGELRERYAEVFGEQARSRQKEYLARSIACTVGSTPPSASPRASERHSRSHVV